MIGCECEVCTSTDKKDDRLRSSILVRSANTTLVVDTGPDFRYQMLREKINKLDFIKMDIEGAEIQALEGARNTILSLMPHFTIASYHIVENEVTYKKVEEFFAEINYPFETIFYDDGEIITYAGTNL